MSRCGVFAAGSIDRRAVLRGGIAISLAGAAPGIAAAVRPNASAIHVYDRRFAAGRASARSALRAGTSVHAVEGDVTGVWLSQLAPRLAGRNSILISGLTAAPALLCLEIMARSEGLRLLSRRSLSGANSGLVSWSLGRAAKGAVR